MWLKDWKFTSLIIASALLVSCESYNQQSAEKAIDRFIRMKFFSPSSYHPKHYYAPQRIKISKEDANTVNSIFSDRNAKAFNGWGMAVDIEALTKNGIKREQSATFYLNLSCDSVISSDVALYFYKN